MLKNHERQVFLSNSNLFFNYLKERYPVFNNSNIFLRDIQYGVKSFFEKRGIKLSYSDCEILADEIIKVFESQNIFQKLTKNSWKVNFPRENVVVES
ncbi:MAG: hypothetical protein C4539_15010 [Ignavibacteriales bacterium]|nr:MAG: hypothetical protein C4539_15010 [Ignavibacteriales bacterium]